MPGFPIKQPIMLSFICPTAVILYHLLTLSNQMPISEKEKKKEKNLQLQHHKN